MFFNYPDVAELIGDILRSTVDCAARKRSSGMHVISESGGGKSRLVVELVRIVTATYFRDDPEKTIRPAVCLDGAPQPCTPNALCGAILAALGDRLAASRTRMEQTKSLTELTAEMLNECEVRLILFDNFQDIPSARRRRGIEQVGLRIRDLMDLTRCAWVFLGTERSRPFVSGEAQLFKRIPYTKTLPYFKISGDDGKIFLRVLQRFDEWLPLAESSFELLRECGGLVHIATEGIFDRIRLLLDNAWPIAVAAGREQLLKCDLLEGFRRSFGSDQENPFREDFSARRLNRPGELYEHFGNEGVAGANDKTAEKRSRRKREAES